VFTADEPAEAGTEKYDETAAAMIAQLRYGSGVPFKRLERSEGNLGIPLPAATQWGVVEKAALGLRPAYDEYIRQAARGEVVHNDDTGMRILRLAREPADPRTGMKNAIRTEVRYPVTPAMDKDTGDEDSGYRFSRRADR
jgi:hypothetical protein